MIKCAIKKTIETAFRRVPRTVVPAALAVWDLGASVCTDTVVPGASAVSTKMCVWRKLELELELDRGLHAQRVGGEEAA